MFKTKKEAEVAISLLKEARRLIEKKDGRYICNILSRLVKDKELNSVEFRCAETIKNYISFSLGTAATYEGWLLNQGIDWWNHNNYSKVIQGRLNWIDYLIEQVKRHNV